MTATSLPKAYRQRTTALAAALGHVAVRFEDGAKTTSARSVRLRHLERTIWPIALASHAVEVFFKREDAGTKARVAAIIRRSGRRSLVVPALACTQEWEPFWWGVGLRSDHVVAMQTEVHVVKKLGVFTRTFDPMVIGNIRSLLGRSGVSIVDRMLKNQSRTVVCATIGPPDCLYMFARPDTMREVASDILDSCHVSTGFAAYASGDFVPIDSVVSSVGSVLPWVGP